MSIERGAFNTREILLMLSQQAPEVVALDTKIALASRTIQDLLDNNLQQQINSVKEQLTATPTTDASHRKELVLKITNVDNTLNTLHAKGTLLAEEAQQLIGNFRLAVAKNPLELNSIYTQLAALNQKIEPYPEQHKAAKEATEEVLRKTEALLGASIARDKKQSDSAATATTPRATEVKGPQQN
jgi:hypothetical protein